MATKPKTTITRADLRAAGACIAARLTFSEVFPRGAPITFDGARRAAFYGLDVRRLAPLLRGRYADAWTAHCDGPGQAGGPKDGLDCCQRTVVKLLRQQYGLTGAKKRKRGRS